MKKLYIILLFATLGSGCAISGNTDQKVTDNQEGVVATVVDRTYKFQADIPISDGWIITEQGEMNDDAELELKSEEKEMYLMAMMENKIDYAITFEDYTQACIKKNKEYFGVTIDEGAEIETDFYQGMKYEFIAVTPEGLKTHMWLRIIETPNYYGQLYTWTLLSKKTANAAELEKLAESFKEVDQIKEPIQ